MQTFKCAHVCLQKKKKCNPEKNPAGSSLLVIEGAYFAV